MINFRTTEKSINFEQKKDSPVLSYERIIIDEIETLSKIYDFLVSQKSTIDDQINKLNALEVQENNSYVLRSEYDEQINQQTQEFLEKIQLFNAEIENKKSKILRLVEANKKINNSVPEFLKFVKNDFKAVAYKKTEYAKHLETLEDQEKQILNQLNEVNESFDEMKSRRHLTYGCMIPHKMNTNVIKPVNKSNNSDSKNIKQKSKSNKSNKKSKKTLKSESIEQKVELTEKKVGVVNDKNVQKKEVTVSKKKTTKSSKDGKNHVKKTKA